MNYIGIDCGSAACKGVLISNNKIIDVLVEPTGWSPKKTSQKVLELILEKNNLLREDVKIGATGYGRVSIDFADKVITEITCHGKGANFLKPDTATVVDIGGQDSKVIELKNGKVVSFQMNDKCAAGTGRFLEMTANRLGIEIEEVGELLKAEKSCPVNSMCAVFAESEIISLLSMGKSREEIVGGVVNSIASRVSALAARINLVPNVLLTGGLSSVDGIENSLSNVLGLKVEKSEFSRHAGAIGAALLSE